MLTSDFMQSNNALNNALRKALAESTAETYTENLHKELKVFGEDVVKALGHLQFG